MSAKPRPVDDQLAFDFRDPDDWEGDRRIIGRIADAIGRTTCAIDNDLAPSRLSHELAEDDRKMPAERLRYYLPRGPRILTVPFVARYAALVDHRLVALAPAKPEELYADLVEALGEMSPDLKTAALARAARKRR